MKKNIIVVLVLVLFGGFNAFSQVEKKPAEPVKTEVAKITVEQRKAQIDKKRATKKERVQANYKAKNNLVSKRDQEMFKALGMDDNQIASYNKIQADNKSAIKKSAQKRKDNPQKFVAEMQEIRETNNAALKALFTADQFVKYMDFNEKGHTSIIKNEKQASKSKKVN